MPPVSVLVRNAFFYVGTQVLGLLLPAFLKVVFDFDLEAYAESVIRYWIGAGRDITTTQLHAALFTLITLGWFAYWLWPSQPVTTQDAFDSSEWENHESYYVWVAACLWENVRPVNQIDATHLAYPYLQRIKGAIESGQINSLDGAFNMNAKVSREELLRLANIHKEKPRFLFSRRKRRSQRKAAVNRIGDQMIELESEIKHLIQHEGQNKTEQELVNVYFTRYSQRVVHLYEDAEKQGHQDADIKQYYEHPETLKNVRHLATRLGAMGHRMKADAD